MQTAEQTRLDLLSDLEVLDTPPEIELDEVTKLASLITSSPVALVSLVDKERQWFKSKVGIEATETPRDISFCTHAIESEGIFEITDALVDSRFKSNPLVTGEPFIRFYAGAPLRMVGGAVGTLCVIDRVPRRLTEAQKDGLLLLSKQVVYHLICRRNDHIHHRLREAVDTQNSGLLLEDHRLRPVFLNPSLINMFDLKGDLAEFTQEGLALLFKNPQEFLNKTKDHRVALKDVRREEFQMASGQWVEREYSPRMDGEKVDVHIWNFRDITDRKNDSYLLEYQKAQMIEGQRLSSLGEMAAGLAHEINNPLTVIYGRASHLRELAQGEKLDLARTLRYAQEILEVTTRVMKIIKGLRSFARVGDNDPMESVLISDIVSDTLTFCRQRCKNGGVELRTPALEAQIAIRARATQISQIILNLVNNSFDAIHDLQEKWIEIDAFTVSGEAVIAVTDSGPGIPESLREKIFDPFFTTKTTDQGTGLGLSISRRIADEHRGRLELDSHSSRTRFLIRLPIGAP